MLPIPASFPPYLSLWQLTTSFHCLLISHCFERVDDEMNVVEYPFAVMADIRRKQALAIAVMAYLSNEDDSRQKKKIPRQRSVWVRNLLRHREEKGAYSFLLKVIIFDDSDDF